MFIIIIISSSSIILLLLLLLLYPDAALRGRRDSSARARPRPRTVAIVYVYIYICVYIYIYICIPWLSYSIYTADDCDIIYTTYSTYTTIWLPRMAADGGVTATTKRVHWSNTKSMQALSAHNLQHNNLSNLSCVT